MLAQKGVVAVTPDELDPSTPRRPPAVPRPHRARVGSGSSSAASRVAASTRRAGEDIDHRRHRLGHLARAAKLLRPPSSHGGERRTGSVPCTKVTGLARDVPGRRAVHAVDTATTSCSAHGTSTPHGAATRRSRHCARGSSCRRATTTATARTPRRPRAGTTASSRPVTRRLHADQRHRAARTLASTRHCWSTQDGSTASGFTTDLVAAIDQAVADGVDVINYSICGYDDRTSSTQPRSRSCSPQRRVSSSSASAGNSGPGCEHRRPSEPVDHDRRSGHAQPHGQRLRDGRRHRATTARRSRRWRSGTLVDAATPRPPGSDPDRGDAVLRRGRQRRRARARSGQGRGQDRALRPRRERRS